MLPPRFCTVVKALGWSWYQENLQYIYIYIYKYRKYVIVANTSFSDLVSHGFGTVSALYGLNQFPCLWLRLNLYWYPLPGAEFEELANQAGKTEWFRYKQSQHKHVAGGEDLFDIMYFCTAQVALQLQRAFHRAVFITGGLPGVQDRIGWMTSLEGNVQSLVRICRGVGLNLWYLFRMQYLDFWSIFGAFTLVLSRRPSQRAAIRPRRVVLTGMQPFPWEVSVLGDALSCSARRSTS